MSKEGSCTAVVVVKVVEEEIESYTKKYVECNTKMIENAQSKLRNHKRKSSGSAYCGSMHVCACMRACPCASE